MKDKLGFAGQKKPKDYTLKKYIALPEFCCFSAYYERTGIIPPVLLEMQINLTGLDLNFAPFKVNIFSRKKFTKAIIDSMNTKADDRMQEWLDNYYYIEEKIEEIYDEEII